VRCACLSNGRCKFTSLCIAVIKYTEQNSVERFVWGVCLPIIMITMMITVDLIQIFNKAYRFNIVLNCVCVCMFMCV